MYDHALHHTAELQLTLQVQDDLYQLLLGFVHERVRQRFQSVVELSFILIQLPHQWQQILRAMYVALQKRRIHHIFFILVELVRLESWVRFIYFGLLTLRLLLDFLARQVTLRMRLVRVDAVGASIDMGKVEAFR